MNTPNTTATTTTPAQTLDRRTIGGIEFEAVPAESRGVRYWRARVVSTGYTFEPGVFHGSTRPAMWADMEHVCRIRGQELWTRDTLNPR
jgi:hypothetical protein